VERDLSNGEKNLGDGKPITVGGVKYAKGLGMHASAEIVVPTDGATTFSARVGVDAEVGQSGSVVFQVFDGTTKLADSGVMRWGGAKTLTVNVAGASQIRLVMTDAGDGSSFDHGDWADAKLTR